MYPYLTTINGCRIPVFYLGLCLSLFLALYYFLFQFKNFVSEASQRYFFVLLMAFGSTLFSCFLIILITTWFGGFQFALVFVQSVTGNILIIALVGFIMILSRQKDVYRLFHLFVRSYFLFLLVLRPTACLMNGCCHGYPNTTYGVTFAEDSITAVRFPGCEVVPTQILEMLWSGLVLIWLSDYRKGQACKNAIFLVLGGLIRLPIMAIRYSASGHAFAMITFFAAILLTSLSYIMAGYLSEKMSTSERGQR